MKLKVMRMPLRNCTRSLFHIAFSALFLILFGSPAQCLQSIPSNLVGPPGFAKDGLICMRSGQYLTSVAGWGRAPVSYNFAAAAEVAINRDLFSTVGRWDAKADWGVMVDQSVVFDDDNRAYTLVIPRYSNLKNAALLVSSDRCKTWTAYRLASINAVLERADFRNDMSGPPTILSFDSYGSIHGKRLWLDLFEANSAGLRRQVPPIEVTNSSIYFGNHSGGGNSTFTTKTRIFVAYPTDDRSGRGTQEAIREYDRASAQFIGGEVVLGRSETKVGPDDHDVTALSEMPDGRIAAVLGAHQALFQITFSNKADTIQGGFSTAEPFGQPLRDGRYGKFTYPSLNISEAGAIIVIARAEGDMGKDDLVQMYRAPNGTWKTWHNGLLYHVLVDPGRPAYMAWRQKISIDDTGKMYLTYRRYENRLTAEEAKSLNLTEVPGAGQCSGGRCWYSSSPNGPAKILLSDDFGLTWKPL